MKAKHSGVCPICDKFIAPGRSEIVRLDAPLRPVADEPIPDRDREPTYADRRTDRGHARPWVHEKCAEDREREIAARRASMARHSKSDHSRVGLVGCTWVRSGADEEVIAPDRRQRVQELTSRIAELATAEDDIMLAWEIRANSANVVVSAATRAVYPDEMTAWEGARTLWQMVLHLGHEVTDEGESEIGVIRRPGGVWRGKVFMVLQPLEDN